MKVVVFGATGTIGKHVIDQSLEQGHVVTAFCRNSTKLEEFKQGNLKTAMGDVFNSADVVKAIKGQDVVIIALGSGKSRKSKVRSEGTKNTVGFFYFEMYFGLKIAENGF